MNNLNIKKSLLPYILRTYYLVKLLSRLSFKISLFACCKFIPQWPSLYNTRANLSISLYICVMYVCCICHPLYKCEKILIEWILILLSQSLSTHLPCIRSYTCLLRINNMQNTFALVCCAVAAVCLQGVLAQQHVMKIK